MSGSGPGVILVTVVSFSTDLCVTAGLGSPSAVGSGVRSVQQGDGWLGSGSGVGLVISSTELNRTGSIYNEANE